MDNPAGLGSEARCLLHLSLNGLVRRAPRILQTGWARWVSCLPTNGPDRSSTEVRRCFGNEGTLGLTDLTELSMCHPRLPHSRLKHHPCVDSQTSTLRFFLQIIQYRISVIFKCPKYTASQQSMAGRSFRTTVSTFGTVHHASAGSSGKMNGAESVGLCGMVVKTIQ